MDAVSLDGVAVQIVKYQQVSDSPQDCQDEEHYGAENVMSKLEKEIRSRRNSQNITAEIEEEADHKPELESPFRQDVHKLA